MLRLKSKGEIGFGSALCTDLCGSMAARGPVSSCEIPGSGRSMGLVGEPCVCVCVCVCVCLYVRKRVRATHGDVLELSHMSQPM